MDSDDDIITGIRATVDSLYPDESQDEPDVILVLRVPYPKDLRRYRLVPGDIVQVLCPDLEDEARVLPMIAPDEDA